MWPFKRKPAKPAPVNPGPINEDWRAGDLAEMLGSGLWSGDGIGPERGDVDLVTCVKIARGQRTGNYGWFLELRGYPGNRFVATSFRKVPPLHSKADAEFTAQIKGLKPSKVRA